MTVRAPRTSPERLPITPPHGEPAHRRAVAALARLTHAISVLRPSPRRACSRTVPPLCTEGFSYGEAMGYALRS